eukprot:jgi/Chrpa1/22575/Chrysochromulina_OHIO_Genome00025133-RA
MSLVGFSLELAGDVSSFTPSVRTEMKSSIAARAGVDPSAVMVTVTSGSVIVGVRIQTPTAMATSVQSAIASATSSPSSATAMLASVTGVSIAVLAVVTPPTVTNVAPPPPLPPPSSPSPSPPPQRPPGALNSAGGGAISILAIVVPAAVVGLLCCLAMVCWWTRRRGVELRRKDVNNWLRNMSASSVSADKLHQQEPSACSVSIPSGSGGSGGGGGGVGIEMSDRFHRDSSETEGSSRADSAEGGARQQDMVRQQKEEAQHVAAARSARESATIVHQPPWDRSSACSAADLSVVTDSHDDHVDAGKHQVSAYELRKEGDDGGGDGRGNGGGRASGSSSGASGNMEAPNCNDPDAPRSAVPGMLHI